MGLEILQAYILATPLLTLWFWQQRVLSLGLGLFVRPITVQSNI